MYFVKYAIDLLYKYAILNNEFCTLTTKWFMVKK